MNNSPSSTRRLLVPRWRSFSATVAAGEVASSSGKGPSKPPINTTDLLRRQVAWQERPSLRTAAEFVETAIVQGASDAALEAANTISNDSDATNLLRVQASALVADAARSQPLAKTHVSPKAAINSAREASRSAPESPIVWVDLALAYVNEGYHEKADRAMKVGVHLAPDNRFVLRSAARLYMHIHKPDFGYYLLRRSSAYESDPWLMSTEVALAQANEKVPITLKRGLAVLKNESTHPFDLSELAGAVATTHAEGLISKKVRRRLFGQSMLEPTDNAVAQAEWASQVAGEDFIDPMRLKGFRTASEAQSMHAFHVGDFRSALDAAKLWIEEEPFSVRALAAAAVSASTDDRYADAIEFARVGLRQDPQSAPLHNSLAFSLASMDQLDQASRVLSKIKFLSPNRTDVLITKANEGLIALRRGQLDRGEGLYREVIGGFEKARDEGLAISAQAYFAREAYLAAHPKASELARDANIALREGKDFVARRILSSMSKIVSHGITTKSLLT